MGSTQKSNKIFFLKRLWSLDALFKYMLMSQHMICKSMHSYRSTETHIEVTPAASHCVEQRWFINSSGMFVETRYPPLHIGGKVHVCVFHGLFIKSLLWQSPAVFHRIPFLSWALGLVFESQCFSTLRQTVKKFAFRSVLMVCPFIAPWAWWIMQSPLFKPYFITFPNYLMTPL